MWKILAMVVVTLFALTSPAKSQNMSTCPLLKPLDPTYGSYGYRHHELHGMGVISKLMRKSGKTCCDGGLGGECRVTTIVHCGAQHLAWLDGVWCPLNDEVTIFNDIALPEGAFGVVCAGKKNLITRCPNSYCAAQAPGL